MTSKVCSKAVFTLATVRSVGVLFRVGAKMRCIGDGDTLRRRALRGSVLDIPVFQPSDDMAAPVLGVSPWRSLGLERFPAMESSIHLTDIPETPKAWLDADFWRRNGPKCLPPTAGRDVLRWKLQRVEKRDRCLSRGSTNWVRRR